MKVFQKLKKEIGTTDTPVPIRRYTESDTIEGKTVVATVSNLFEKGKLIIHQQYKNLKTLFNENVQPILNKGMRKISVEIKKFDFFDRLIDKLYSKKALKTFILLIGVATVIVILLTVCLIKVYADCHASYSTTDTRNVPKGKKKKQIQGDINNLAEMKPLLKQREKKNQQPDLRREYIRKEKAGSPLNRLQDFPKRTLYKHKNTCSKYVTDI